MHLERPQSITWIAQVQAALVGGLGSIQIAYGGDVHVSVAEVEFGQQLRPALSPMRQAISRASR